MSKETENTYNEVNKVDDQTEYDGGIDTSILWEILEVFKEKG